MSGFLTIFVYPVEFDGRDCWGVRINGKEIKRAYPTKKDAQLAGTAGALKLIQKSEELINKVSIKWEEKK
jgi:hypothetical protein